MPYMYVSQVKALGLDGGGMGNGVTDPQMPGKLKADSLDAVLRQVCFVFVISFHVSVCVCMCAVRVCVCACVRARARAHTHTHAHRMTHTHTHTHTHAHTHTGIRKRGQDAAAAVPGRNGHQGHSSHSVTPAAKIRDPPPAQTRRACPTKGTTSFTNFRRCIV